MDKTVIVLVSPQVTEVRDDPVLKNHALERVFGAQLLNLHLTAYGRTSEEATGNVKRLFREVVEEKRGDGSLEAWLNRSGVEWYWQDEYPAGKPPYEEPNSTLADQFLSGSPTAPHTLRPRRARRRLCRKRR